MESMESGKEAESMETTDMSKAVARSIKCIDCNKLFKDAEMAEWHAHKTNYVNFEESTEEIMPLTEEEKKQKLEELRIAMQERRRERQQKEEQEQRLKEIQMRKEAMESQKLRRELEDQEMKKEIERYKREKQEQSAYMAHLKAQINADKKERISKSTQLPAASSFSENVTVLPPSTVTNYVESKLQIRLSDGRIITQTFQAEDTMQSVYEFVRNNRKGGVGSFSLMTTFPRRVYETGDMNKTLKQLDLVPSATLILKHT